MFLAAATLAGMVVWGASIYAYALYLTPLEAEFGWSRAVLGGSMSIFFLASPLGPWIGIRVERYGPKVMLLVGAALECGGCIALGYADSILALYSLRILMGLGYLFISVSFAVGIPQWFDRHMGLALGIGTAGFHAGGLIFAPLTQYLLEGFGWRGAAMTSGAIIGIVAVPILAIGVPSKKETDKRVASSRKSETLRNQSEVSGYTLREALRTRLLIIILAGTFIFFGVQSALLAHLAPYLSDLAFSGEWTAGLVTLVAGVATASVVGWGAASDRWSHKRLLLVLFSVLSLTTGSMIWLSEVPSELWATILAVGLGMAVGCDALWLMMLRTSFGEKDYGAIYGVWLFMTLISMLLGPILVGWAYDAMHSYLPVFWLLLGAIVSMAAAIVTSGFQPAARRLS